MTRFVGFQRSNDIADVFAHHRIVEQCNNRSCARKAALGPERLQALMQLTAIEMTGSQQLDRSDVTGVQRYDKGLRHENTARGACALVVEHHQGVQHLGELHCTFGCQAIERRRRISRR